MINSEDSQHVPAGKNSGLNGERREDFIPPLAMDGRSPVKSKRIMGRMGYDRNEQKNIYTS